MINQLIFIFMLILVLQACGANLASSPADSTDTRNPLVTITYTTDPISPESLFVSYSVQAGRASIIDPVNQVETWGKQHEGFEFAISHNNFDQISLVSNNSLLVTTQSSSRKFELPFKPSHTSYASEILAFAFTNITGNSAYLIRSLGDGFWQEQTFDTPWPAPTIGTIKLASVFSSNSQAAVLFNTIDMSYWRLQANSSTEPLVADSAHCPGKDNELDNSITRSIQFDDINQILFVGNNTGKITALRISDTCDNYSTAPSLQLFSIEPIISITTTASSEIYVTQEESPIHKLSYANDGTLTILDQYNNVCDYPIGLLPLAEPTLLISCLDNINENSNPKTAFYQVFNTEIDTVIQEISPQGEFSGIGIDRNNLLMYRMREGSLGILETINLINGDTSVKTGLFLHDLLD